MKLKIIYYNKYLFVLLFLLLLTLNNKINKKFKDFLLNEKWIVFGVFNPPKLSLFNTLKILDSWNMIIISCNESIDREWKKFKLSDKIIFLSIKKQKKLNYEIIKYLSLNSYSRKNIGYLYAISHGAKEIYELDEDIIISNSTSLTRNHSNLCYGINNYTKMINPYSYYGQNKIWPKGFRINDIGKQYNNKFYLINRNQTILKPLIIQGLINNIPDIDAILYQTKVNGIINYTFYNNIFPLFYFPGNYIPINSKNTIFFYEVFPFLFIPTSVNDDFSDILRGYILQRFAWGYNGIVMYSSSNIYLKNNKCLNSSNFIKEKKLYYKLDSLLNTLNFKNSQNTNPLELFIDLMNNLSIKGFIKKRDLMICKIFLKDLLNLGYSNKYKFIKEINYNYKEFLRVKSELNIYIPFNQILTLKNLKNNNTLKLINHYYSNKKYDDILLIINYNHKGFYKKLNNYLLSLYKIYFKNIIFIVPSVGNNFFNNNIFFCNNSYYGYYSYICFNQIYINNPNFKGYLFINDDTFVKIWELDNLDFSIPWFNQFSSVNKKWRHYIHCKNIYNIFTKNSIWKNNIINFWSNYDVPKTIADFYYIPNNLVWEFFENIKEMYKSKIFLECAVPTTFGILLYSKYQIIIFRGLWGKKRKEAIHYLKNDYNQIVIHPIKFSNTYFRKEVTLYVYFINSKDY